MADITRVASCSMDASTGMVAPQLSGDLYAAELLPAGSPCYIKAADGKVYRSNGTAANEAATFFGFVPRTCQINEPVSLYALGARFKYGTGLTIGAKYFVSATVGQLADAASTGGLVAIARAVSTTDIQCIAIAT